MSDEIRIQFTRFSAFYSPLIATIAGGFLRDEGFTPKHSIAPAGKSAIEAVARYKIGITTIHINNGGYSGYGPGFWGAGHDPYTWKVSDHAKACMANMAKAVGFHSEDVDKPSEIIPALKRAFDENAKGRPAFVEFLCSHHPVHGGWVR